mgnify:FL=1
MRQLIHIFLSCLMLTSCSTAAALPETPPEHLVPAEQAAQILPEVPEPGRMPELFPLDQEAEEGAAPEEGSPAPETPVEPLPETQRVVDPTRPMVALTFDDGPHAVYTDQILDILEKNGAVATFFEVARNLPKAPDAVRRAVDLGCEIGSHSYRHANLGKMDQAAQQADQAAADAIFQEVLGTTPTLLRPPYGSMNKTLKTTCGRSIVTWSIDTEDWLSKDADKVVASVQNAGNLDGQVILLHSIYGSTVEATEVLVPWLLEQGYQLVTVSELIQLRFGDQVEPNRTYNYDYFRFQVPPLPAETAPAAA